MAYISVFATLALVGCTHPGPESVVDLGELVITMQHLNDTPLQHAAWVTERLARLDRWCLSDNDHLSCTSARMLREEEHELTRTGGTP